MNLFALVIRILLSVHIVNKFSAVYIVVKSRRKADRVLGPPTRFHASTVLYALFQMLS